MQKWNFYRSRWNLGDLTHFSQLLITMVIVPLSLQVTPPEGLTTESKAFMKEENVHCFSLILVLLSCSLIFFSIIKISDDFTIKILKNCIKIEHESHLLSFPVGLFII